MKIDPDKDKNPKLLILYYSYGSLLFLLVCLMGASIFFSAEFIRKERERAEVLKSQLSSLFEFQSQSIAEEMWTKNYEAILFRVANISKSVGNANYTLTLVDNNNQCLFISDKNEKCIMSKGLSSEIESFKNSNVNSKLRFDGNINKYVYFSPIYLGPELGGYIYASISDPYIFFRGNTYQLAKKTLIPTFTIFFLLWVIWYFILQNYVLRPYFKKIIETSKKAAISDLARQVSHDIRSPLAALKVVRDLGAGSLDPDQAKLLNLSIERITDIANTILSKKGTTELSNKNEHYFLWILVDQIVSEKRVQCKNFNDVEIVFQAEDPIFGLNAICNQTEFMRAISNVMDNAVEAKLEKRTLKLSVNLKSDQDKVILVVTDNGKGIPSENLSKVFDEGFTLGKKNGSGLGLYQVKQSVESWGGKIHIQSTLNRGTTLTIELKKSASPLWLADEIEINLFSDILVLDDEEYVFQILKDKFNGFDKNITYFKAISDFKNHLIKSNGKNLCFVDHDLKQETRGLDLIEQLEIQKTSILLTGNYDDRQVQQNSLKAGIKILPKPLIHEISIIS